MVRVVAAPTDTRVIAGEGTPEHEWAASGLLDDLPGLDLADCARAVVIAPHPDDETLGAGGLLATLLAGGVDVVVVFATDGEASHPKSDALSPSDLRIRRMAESDSALGALAEGATGRVSSVRLRLPDGGLAGSERTIVERACQVLRPGDWCLATWELDGHPDHEAAGRAAREAAGSTGARYFGYPVWAWHWATPAALQLPLAGARLVPLSSGARRKKTRAVGCFQSQILPIGPRPEDAAIVPPADLAHFMRPHEVVFT